MHRPSKYQPLFISVLCALALALTTTLGCGSKPSSDQTTTKVPAPKDTGKAVSGRGKSWEGWRWKGDRDNCYFTFENTCYGTEESACKAAECAEGKCDVKKGAPAKVSCRE